MSKVSIIIPAYNHGQLTINCLNDVIKTCGVNFEVLLVDDGSTELVYKVMSKLFSDIKILRNNTNLGFAKSINYGLREATGNHLMLLNNDITIQDPMWLKKMMDGLHKRKLDMISVAGGRLDSDYNYLPGEATKESEEFSFLVGWCLLFKREVFNGTGFLSEEFGRGFWEDVDYCYRAKKKGFKQGIISGIGIKHLYHSTFKAENINITEQYLNNREIFLKKIGNK